MLKLSDQEVEDLIKGDAVLGTGGGFPPDESLNIFKNLLRSKKELILKTIDEFKDEDMVFSAYGVGSLKDTKIDVKKTVRLALEELKKYLKTDFKAIVPGEIGGEMAAFEIGTALNLPVLDGDLVGGRAAPEIENDTFSVRNIPVTPLAVASEDGNIAVYTQSTSTKNVETFIRGFAIMVKGSVFLAGYPANIKTIKETIGVGTLSKSIQIGQAIRKAIENKLDVVREVIKVGGGRELFRGTVEKLDKVSKEGFLVGEFYIKNGSGEVMRVAFKNENLVAWINAKPVISCPDLICVLDSKTGEGIHNTEMAKGATVVVLGIPSLPIWREKRGIEIFGPKAFGFQIDYVPFKL